MQISCQSADIDERAVEALLGDIAPTAVARELALAKAKSVSANHPGALVIGADQVLEHEGQLLHKAATITAADAKLAKLQGQTHHLIAAVALVQNGETLWSTHDTASLTMRSLSTNDRATYLAKAGDAATASVGAYRLEEFGASLFERIDGDYFTILGMPLLPLLGALREHGIDPIRPDPLHIETAS
ncbi:MAG: Maf family nucleotide pyrophosphatase [Hyphomicrobiales bacterium]